MTPPLRFCLALHVHQPWGNFDSVFEQHLAEVYRPLLTTLMDGELWPIAMHLSGPLLEWLEIHAPDFLDQVAGHAIAGRLELLCAGHDEPILTILSRADQVEQVERHREWIRSRLGVDARGLWLTERVWEPGLPEELAAAGVEFVLVDDRHFRVSGFSPDQLHTHFVSEAGGKRLNVFPIDERLRYLVPFRPATELADYFRSLRSAGHPLAILGDDGEKFGGWPGTRKWLYDDGWLESFLGTMRELRDNGEVRLSRFEDALGSVASGGLAYLPSASYREMEGWSLPFEPARALLRLEHDWDGERIAGVDGGLLRGSHWRNFLVRYPESNRMHKVMLALSAQCRERGNPAEVRRAIGRAQCNDAYWHGVFGGLYLPFLRGAVWHHLATAEALLRAVEPVAIDIRDVDADGHDEVWIRGRSHSVIVAPARGGMIDVWLDLIRRENLLNVVARHLEAYHVELDRGGDTIRPPGTDDQTGAPSIHDLETELKEVPPIDTEPRGLFVERVVAGPTELVDFVGGTVAIEHSWAGARLQSRATIDGDVATIVLEGDSLTKKIVISGGGTISCGWNWSAADYPPDAWFTSELSYSGSLTIEAGSAERWDYEIETVAKSEKGFDRSVQGHAVVLRWPIAAAGASVTVLRP